VVMALSSQPTVLGCSTVISLLLCALIRGGKERSEELRDLYLHLEKEKGKPLNPKPGGEEKRESFFNSIRYFFLKRPF